MKVGDLIRIKGSNALGLIVEHREDDWCLVKFDTGEFVMCRLSGVDVVSNLSEDQSPADPPDDPIEVDIVKTRLVISYPSGTLVRIIDSVISSPPYDIGISLGVDNSGTIRDGIPTYLVLLPQRGEISVWGKTLEKIQESPEDLMTIKKRLDSQPA